MLFACEERMSFKRFSRLEYLWQRRTVYAICLTGEEVARQIVSTEFVIPSSCVIAAARDRVSVNDVAMHTVGVIYRRIIAYSPKR